MAFRRARQSPSHKLPSNDFPEDLANHQAHDARPQVKQNDPDHTLKNLPLIISTVDVKRLPPLSLELGVKYTPPSGPIVDTYPVILWGSYTYCALSYVDNRNAMCICAFDFQGRIADKWPRRGARHIQRITFEKGVVTFIGEKNASIKFTRAELEVPPKVRLADLREGLHLPSALSYYLSHESTMFPVIDHGPYRFWPTSYTDGRDGLAVVVTDPQRTLRYIIKCHGARDIWDIKLDSSLRRISLIGRDGRVAYLPYRSVLVAYCCRAVYTTNDLRAICSFLFPCFDNMLDFDTLERNMPAISWATCYGILPSYPRNRYELKAFSNIGSAVGAVAGALSGFYIGGSAGAKAGALVGISALSAYSADPTYVKRTCDSRYKSTSEEGRRTLLSDISPRVVGPFPRAGTTPLPSNVDIVPYHDAPYSAAVARPCNIRSLEAHSPMTMEFASFPRNPYFSPQIIANGDEIVKYVFIVVKISRFMNKLRGHQMRIHPAEFYPSAIIPKYYRTNRSYVIESLLFHRLSGDNDVHAAGNMYVNSTKQTIVGLDVRSAHSFLTFNGQDQAVAESARRFLARLGYDVKGAKLGDEMWMWLMDNTDGLV